MGDTLMITNGGYGTCSSHFSLLSLIFSLQVPVMVLLKLEGLRFQIHMHNLSTDMELHMATGPLEDKDITKQKYKKSCSFVGEILVNQTAQPLMQ